MTLTLHFCIVMGNEFFAHFRRIVWFCQDPSMSMKISNFHYDHFCQNRFRCYYIFFMFVIGNQILHIYMEPVLCISIVST